CAHEERRYDAAEGGRHMLSSRGDDDAQDMEGFLTEAFSPASIRAFEEPMLEAGVPLMRHAASLVACTA
ncbi:MAG: hypothetical protein L0K70_06650, partial [Bifidobacterium crudilactis]|nr:hypothetical protein [Bifidobacterium crudilactis]